MLRRALLATVLVVAALAPAAPAQAAPGLTATFSAANNGSWFLDEFVVANPTAASIAGWTLEFDLPAGVTMGNFYNGVANCTVFHDTQSVSTYCYTGNGGQWWTFDDTWSIGQKTTWLKSKGLLGAMVREMSGDTANGTLMTTLHNGL